MTTDPAATGPVAFDDALRSHIAANLASHTPRTEPLGGRRAASVAVVVTADDNGLASVLLTRRSSRLRGHRGQWALPGGRIDPGERPVDAAMRESHEEIGLALGLDDLLGRLDDYPTRSGYLISTFVFWAVDAVNLRPNPDEVDSLHEIPLEQLMRPDSPRLVEIPESDRPVIQLPIFDLLIHAPTAAPLYQFRLLGLEGDPSPVSHYDQPVFAWR
ncbi:MAG: CoA pyrophosphatase [Actinomycetia bacterium]|nr:CoA pyrophosphatase [Actinomycetes bacterium]MCP4958701.1 CoA pyrophosphatase [Actinomycetes bacterium]